MGFRIYRPRSILRLILVGFALVAVPLMVALVNAALSVDRLANQSQRAVYQAVRATQNSQALVEAVTAMERNARQYQVLGEHALYEVFDENHGIFQATAAILNDMPLSPPQRSLLARLQGDERDMHAQLARYAHDAPQLNAVMDRFGALAAMTEQFLSQNRRAIQQGVETMQDTAQQTQRVLVVQAMALVPAALLLTGLFAVLIARPVRQLDQVVRRLGNEEFGPPVVIRGPRDLELLGERLEWLRSRLQELEAEKTKFLRHMSHELKTPLTSIREGAGLLGEEVVGTLNVQQQEIAAILRENTVQLQRLIEDLLNVSMATARTSVVTRRSLALDDLITDVLADHKMALLARHLELSSSLQPVQLEGDEEKIRTIVDNLLSNATKFAPVGGIVSVVLNDLGEAASIEVSDSGAGIPAEERERVFEAFYQGRHHSKSHIKGTGLGLSIAKEYVQAHGGAIEVVEQASPGARVRVTLPKQGVAA